MAGNFGYGRMMVNAGRSASCGAEISLRGSALDDRLTWAASYGFTASTFRNYTDSIATMAEGKPSYQQVDYRGNKVPFVPAHTMSLLADYRFTIGNGILKNIITGANAVANGPTYWDAANELKQNFYAVVGAHVTFDFGNVDLDLWGRNLSNVHYSTFLVNSSVDGTTRSFAQRGTPIQAGFDLRLKF